MRMVIIEGEILEHPIPFEFINKKNGKRCKGEHIKVMTCETNATVCIISFVHPNLKHPNGTFEVGRIIHCYAMLFSEFQCGEPVSRIITYKITDAKKYHKNRMFFSHVWNSVKDEKAVQKYIKKRNLMIERNRARYEKKKAEMESAQYDYADNIEASDLFDPFFG